MCCELCVLCVMCLCGCVSVCCVCVCVCVCMCVGARFCVIAGGWLAGRVSIQSHKAEAASGSPVRTLNRQFRLCLFIPITQPITGPRPPNFPFRSRPPLHPSRHQPRCALSSPPPFLCMLPPTCMLCQKLGGIFLPGVIHLTRGS